MHFENATGDARAFIAEHAGDWLVGAVDEVVERIASYAEAGVARIYMQHLDHADDSALELIAHELAPRIAEL
jgi:hypothetical protein